SSNVKVQTCHCTHHDMAAYNGDMSRPAQCSDPTIAADSHDNWQPAMPPAEHVPRTFTRGSGMTDNHNQPDFANAPLLSIDVQRDVLTGGPLDFASPELLLPNMARVVDAFRAANRPIVHVVRLYLRDGRNAELCRQASLASGGGALVVGTPGSALIPDLVPDSGVDLDADRLLAGRFQYLSSKEAAMYKPRCGAFFRTQL